MTTPSTTTATPEPFDHEAAVAGAHSAFKNNCLDAEELAVESERLTHENADLERRLTAALAELERVKSECRARQIKAQEYCDSINAITLDRDALRADLERAREESNQFRILAARVIKRNRKRVDELAALRSELDASLRREGVLRDLATKLMRTCYDEANRIANHSSCGAAALTMRQLYNEANAAKSALGAGSEEGRGE